MGKRFPREGRLEPPSSGKPVEAKVDFLAFKGLGTPDQQGGQLLHQNFQISSSMRLVSCVKFNFHVSSSCLIWIFLRPNFLMINSQTDRLIEGSSPTGVSREP